jgi:hypothetical protein
LLGLEIIVVIEDNLIVMKGETEIYMMRNIVIAVVIMKALRTALIKWRKKNQMTQLIYRNLKLLGLEIIVVIEDNLIVMKGETEIYMIFEATPSRGDHPSCSSGRDKLWSRL